LVNLGNLISIKFMKPWKWLYAILGKHYYNSKFSKMCKLIGWLFLITSHVCFDYRSQC
jgi:hypothetical protein